MVKKYILFTFIILLSACATTSEPEYKYVYKRVPYCPVPPSSERPVLDIEKYDWNKNQLQNNPEIVLVSIDQLKDYASRLESIIESYRKYSEAELDTETEGIRTSAMISTGFPAASGMEEKMGVESCEKFDFVEEYRKLKMDKK